MRERSAISGSHGFLGSHLSERLPNAIKLGRDGFVPMESDTIYDLAAFGNMAGHSGDPTKIYQANLMRVIEENKLVNNQKWIFISTSSVKLPIQTAYSLSKKASEEFLQASGKRVAIIRPFTITGVGDQKDHLIPKLINSCYTGEEMPFVGWPKHDFLDVEDFVDALLLIKDKGEFKGEVYEVGGGEETSNDTVRQMVEEITGRKANLKMVENMRAYDTKSWKANLERISTLGWKPKVNLYQTITNMVGEYVRQNITNI